MTGDLDAMIRDQAADDADAVRALLTAAFADEPAVSVLEGLLSTRMDSEGYVALVDGSVVGHVRLTRGWIDATRQLVEVRVLSPLSVSERFQRRGLGSALVAHALDRAAAAKVVAVFLEGDPAYYRRLGWSPASSIGVTPPSDRIPADACQVVCLPAYERWMRGRLVYADAFWATDTVGLR